MLSHFIFCTNHYSLGHSIFAANHPVVLLTGVYNRFKSSEFHICFKCPKLVFVVNDTKIIGFDRHAFVVATGAGFCEK